MKTKHETFRFFVVRDAEGGKDQETGRTVMPYDTADEAYRDVAGDLECAFSCDPESLHLSSEQILNFVPGNEPAEVFSFALENGGDEDDWLREEISVMYTNIWEEKTAYEI